MDKSGLRQAAEKIEKAIEAYGAGDLTTSARELEEALKLMPQHARAKLMLGWVRDLASGKRRLDGLDDETLAAIDLGLDEPMRGGDGWGEQNEYERA